MISWIQNTFQHHFRTVFAVLLGLLIISFVFVIGPQSGIGNSDGSRQAMFFGHDLSSEIVRQQIKQDANLSLYLHYGSAGFAEDQLIDYGKDRLVGLHLADQAGIPKPTAAQLETTIRELPIFRDDKGGFDAKRYDDFLASLKQSGVSQAAVKRVLEDEFRRTEAAKLLAGGGYVLEQSVAADLARLGTEWTIRYARFDYAAFPTPAQPGEDQLETYYKANTGLFVVAPRAVVRLVTFPVSAFVGEVTFTEPELAAFFEERKFNYATPGATPEAQPVTPELAAVRARVEADYRTTLAAQAAVKAASDFGYAIFERKLKKDAPAILELAARFRGQVGQEVEFTEQKGLGGLWSPSATRAAFLLADDRFFSDPIPFGQDQGVILWKETRASYVPSFAEARPDVLTRYLENEKRKAFGEAGISWKNAIAAKLAGGASFADAVNGLLGSPKVEVKDVAPFSARQPPTENNPTVFGAIEGLAAGQISEFLTSAQDAYIVQVIERKVPAVDSTNPQYSDLRKFKTRRSAQYFANAVQRDLAAEEQKEYSGSAVAR